MGSISVFSILNLVPDAKYQCFRIFSRLEYLSSCDKYIVVSSAYILIIILFCSPGILYPLIPGEFLQVHARGSVTKSKSR
jgi:hypothetical protein